MKRDKDYSGERVKSERTNAIAPAGAHKRAAARFSYFSLLHSHTLCSVLVSHYEVYNIKFHANAFETKNTQCENIK